MNRGIVMGVWVIAIISLGALFFMPTPSIEINVNPPKPTTSTPTPIAPEPTPPDRPSDSTQASPPIKPVAKAPI